MGSTSKIVNDYSHSNFSNNTFNNFVNRSSDVPDNNAHEFDGNDDSVPSSAPAGFAGVGGTSNSHHGSVSNEGTTVNFITITTDNTTGAVILPANIDDAAHEKKGKTEHVLKTFLPILPYLHKDYEKHKGANVEATEQTMKLLRKVLQDLMKTAKSHATDAMKRKIVENFKDVTKGHSCINWEDIKKFITSSYSKEQMKTNPFWVFETCTDLAYSLTNDKSSFTETELIDALIKCGEDGSMKWTIPRNTSHQLVKVCVKACVDALKQLHAAETKGHGVCASFRKPTDIDQRKGRLWTEMHHGPRKSYLLAHKAKIPRLNSLSSTPDKNCLRTILIDHYNGVDAEKISAHSHSGDETNKTSVADKISEGIAPDGKVSTSMIESLGQIATYASQRGMTTSQFVEQLTRESKDIMPPPLFPGDNDGLPNGYSPTSYDSKKTPPIKDSRHGEYNEYLLLICPCVM